MEIEVNFSNTDPLAKFYIILNNNEFVNKWATNFSDTLLTHCLDSDAIYLGSATENSINEILCDSCNIINAYVNNPSYIVWDDTKTHEFYNYLHLKFEDLHIGWDNHQSIMHSAPDSVKRAIRRLNIYLHSLEGWKGAPTKLLLSFDAMHGFDRYQLTEDDKTLYTLDPLPPGTLTLAQAELGKNAKELFNDKLDASYDNFIKHEYFSANSMLWYDEFNNNIEFTNWLIANELDPTDVTFGHLPLGHVTDINEAIEIINEYKTIYNLKLIK